MVELLRTSTHELSLSKQKYQAKYDKAAHCLAKDREALLQWLRNALDLTYASGRYEAVSDEHHDHIVCTKCGRVEEFIDDVIEQRQLLAAKNHGFTVSDHSLYIYGLCASCQALTKN